MSKYTPGPWHCEVLKINRTGDIHRGVFTEAVEILPGRFEYVLIPTPDLSEGNMQLIAAAPELLLACKALIDLANESDVQPKSEQWLLFQTILKQSNAAILAKSAIAKAEGTDD
jgi:hypothetical protein